MEGLCMLIRAVLKIQAGWTYHVFVLHKEKLCVVLIKSMFFFIIIKSVHTDFLVIDFQKPGV